MKLLFKKLKKINLSDKPNKKLNSSILNPKN